MFIVKQAEQYKTGEDISKRPVGNVRLVSHNLGANRSAQISNGVLNPDPDLWSKAGRYNFGDEVLGADGNIYAWAVNNNQIADPQNQGEFINFAELQRRVADRLCQVEGVDDTASFFIGAILKLTCIDNAPTAGTGTLSGIITIRNNNNFTWNGITGTASNTPKSFTATRAPNDGANDAPTQRWIVENVPYDFTKTGEIYIPNITGETGLTASFTGQVNYGRDIDNIYGYLDPAPATPIQYPSDHAFLDAIQFWVISRSKNELAFLDGRPQTSTGRKNVLELEFELDFIPNTIAIIGLKTNRISVNWLTKEADFNDITSRPVKQSTTSIQLDTTSETTDLILTDLDSGRAYASLNGKYFIVVSLIPFPPDAESQEFDNISSIGQIVFGNSVNIGTTNPDSFAKEVLDFSKKDRTIFGVLDVIERFATFALKAKVIGNRKSANQIEQTILNILPAKPAIFYTGEEGKITNGEPYSNVKNGTILYGVLKRAQLTHPAGSKNQVQIDMAIDGLV